MDLIYVSENGWGENYENPKEKCLKYFDFSTLQKYIDSIWESNISP
jgi:hypothetical protein